MVVKGQSLQMRSQTELQQDASREICFTEHSAGGFFSVPIWQVWQRRAGEERWEPLFIVVSGFQQREPGVPELASNGSSISDKRQSYSFDLNRDVFSVNKQSENVYLGPFRCAPPEK